MSTLRRLLRTVDGRAGAAIVGALMVLSFVVAPLLGDPNASHFALAGAADGGPPFPSAAHPLGFDPLYRDELARLGAGGRVSLAIAFAAAAIASLLGVLVGVGSAVSDRFGARALDQLLMRLVDVLLAFPFLLLVTTVGVLVGRTDVPTMVLVLGLTSFPGMARVVRARALVVLDQDYVLGARSLGAGLWRIGLRHVVPNVMTTAVVMATSLIGSIILAEAVLGYLAVGLPPPDASWGRMLHEAETFVVLRPLLIAMPALCILLAMLGFHRLGEGLRVVTSREARAATWFKRFPFPLDVAFVALVFALFIALPQGELERPAASFSAVPPPQRGGVLRLATAYSVRTLDPALASEEIGVNLCRLVYGRLVAFDEHGTFVPDLATSIEWSDGARALTLSLRPGVRFQDGALLTAADVKRSIERALGPSVPSPFASHFEHLSGMKAFREGKAEHIAGIEVLGDRTVRFRLDEPNSTLPSLLSMSFVAPVCPSVTGAPGSTPDAQLCGAGPFRIASFESEEGLTLARHEGYHDPELPYLDGIRMSFRVQHQAQRLRFERGELDLVRELASSDALRFAADAHWRPLMGVVENLRVSAIFMNTERPPFDNLALRRAVAFAVDPSVLSRVRPDVFPLAQVVPPGVPGRPVDAPGRRHDLAAALAAMKEAGYPFDPSTGEGGYPDPIEYLTVPESFEQFAAEVYQQQLAAIGIRIRLKLVGSQSYFALTQRRGQATMGWAGWQADYPDPLTFFDPNLASSAIADITQNYSFFADPELDRLLLAAREETDADKRELLFASAEERVRDQAPWVPTVTPRTIEVRQPWLFGYAPSALTSLDFTRTYLGSGAR